MIRARIRNGKTEGRPLTGYTFNINLSAVGYNQPFNYSQTEPYPAVLAFIPGAAFFSPVETVK